MKRFHLGKVENIEQARQLFNQKANQSLSEYCLSVETKNSFTIKHLQIQEQFPLMYWKSRDDDNEYFCWGIAKNFATIPTDLDPEIPIFAGVAFDNTTPQWPGFSDKIYWMPKWIVRQNNASTLLFQVVAKKITIPLPNGTVPLQTTHIPNKTIWTEQIEELKSCIQKERFSKIVLSRQSCVNVKDIWSVFTILTTQQPQCYHFLFSPKQNHVFVGCSPERLFSITNNTLHTEAVAGTRPRGWLSRGR